MSDRINGNGDGIGHGRPGPGRPKETGGKLSASARRVKRLRRELLLAVRPEDIREIVLSLVRAARVGDIAAARVLMDRIFGPSEAADLEERLSRIESAISESEK